MKNQVARAGDTVNGRKLLPGSGAPGPGRPKGVKNSKPPEFRRAAQDILQQILREGPTPLEIMWKMMTGKRKFNALTLEAAKAAAPYVHPKLSQIALSGQLGVTHEEALARLDRLEDDDEEPQEADFQIIEE